MTKCEQCGYMGSDWCYSCTIVTLEEYMSAYKVRFSEFYEAKMINPGNKPDDILSLK